jgi:hypothetical protein
MGNPRVAVLMGPVRWSPRRSFNAIAVFRDANQESATTTRCGFLSSSRFVSFSPILEIILKVQAVVAPWSMQYLSRCILSFPSCISAYMQTPDEPSQTVLSSAPSGCGLRFTYERCGIPPGPDWPVQAIMDSSGVSFDPARKFFFLKGV